MPNYWLSITRPENVAIDGRRNFNVEGFREYWHRRVEQIRPGDRFVVYAMRWVAFVAITEVSSRMYRDDIKIWVSQEDKPNEIYPLRFQTTPILLLPDDAVLDVRPLVAHLKFIPEGLKPNNRYGRAFRALTSIPREDYELIEARMSAKLPP